MNKELKRIIKVLIEKPRFRASDHEVLFQASEINKRYKNMLRKITDTKDNMSNKSQRSVDSWEKPKNPIHPGEILLEAFLEPMELTQAAFADKLGWTKAKLTELIRGKRGITAETALDLAAALKTSPKVWMNLQAPWDLDQAMKARSA